MGHNKPGIVAVFNYVDEFTQTINQLKNRQDFHGHEAVSPTSYHELMDVAESQFGASPVRWFTCVGGITGVLTGFGMPLWMDYDWPIVVGGKTAGLPSLPAYFIFGFELMVLFGAIATIFGMIIMGRLPNPKARIYDNRATDDKFIIFVPGADPDSEQAQFLKKCGANEIYRAKE